MKELEGQKGVYKNRNSRMLEKRRCAGLDEKGDGTEGSGSAKCARDLDLKEGSGQRWV